MDESDTGSTSNIKRAVTLNTMSFSGVSRKGGRSSRTNTIQTQQDWMEEDAEITRHSA